MRAIDKHEPAILDVLRWCDGGGDVALGTKLVAAGYELQPDRLGHLVQVWCAVAGIEAPFYFETPNPDACRCSCCRGEA